MATVSMREIVDDIIRGNGHYMGDPLVVRIVEYNNQFNGDLAWGLTYQGEDPNRYLTAPACHNPRVIFDHDPSKGVPAEAILEEL
jgi:hypothetical protein